MFDYLDQTRVNFVFEKVFGRKFDLKGLDETTSFEWMKIRNHITIMTKNSLIKAKEYNGSKDRVYSTLNTDESYFNDRDIDLSNLVNDSSASEKQSWCYFFLDSGFLEHLHKLSFIDFVKSIFYVGVSKTKLEKRSLTHLLEVGSFIYNSHSGVDEFPQNAIQKKVQHKNYKTKRFEEIWERNHSVIVYKFIDNLTAKESKVGKYLSKKTLN